MFKGGIMGALSERAAASRCHSPSGCMQWDSKYETYNTHTVVYAEYPSQGYSLYFLLKKSSIQVEPRCRITPSNP